MQEGPLVRSRNKNGRFPQQGDLLGNSQNVLQTGGHSALLDPGIFRVSRRSQDTGASIPLKELG